MYQALLYLKTNLPVCLFTHSKDIKIGQSCQELRGVSKSPLGLKHPVGPALDHLCIMSSDFQIRNATFDDSNRGH